MARGPRLACSQSTPLEPLAPVPGQMCRLSSVKMAIDPEAAAGKMKERPDPALAAVLAERAILRELTVMSFELHDIVMLRVDLGARVYAIVEVKPFFAGTEYIAVKLDKGPFVKRYRLRDDDIGAKIGT